MHVRLPARYAENWFDAFHERLRPALVPGVRILDIGSGRWPTLSPDQRPPECLYVGLDLSMAELQRAPSGSYDQLIAGDAIQRQPQLVGQFDLVISFQVFEHVKPLDAVFGNAHAYLRPGGRLVTQMSGMWSAFGVINRLVPQRLGVWLMQQLLQRDPETIFPAYYHDCSYSALARILQPWSTWEILPRYKGGEYFGFFTPLHASYMRYEEWAHAGQHRNLATHYLVTATR